MMGVLKSDFEMCFCNNNAPKHLDPLQSGIIIGEKKGGGGPRCIVVVYHHYLPEYYFRFPAGGWKVNLLKAELARRKGKEEDEGMMLFTDSYDVVFTAGKESILGNYYLQDQMT